MLNQWIEFLSTVVFLSLHVAVTSCFTASEYYLYTIMGKWCLAEKYFSVLLLLYTYTDAYELLFSFLCFFWVLIFELPCVVVFIGLFVTTSLPFAYVWIQCICVHMCEGKHMCVCMPMNAQLYGVQRLITVVTLDAFHFIH